VNGTLAIPRIVKGSFDIPLVAIAATTAVIGSVGVASNLGLGPRAIAGVLAVAFIALVLSQMARLELSLYVLLPLLTAVRVEPAPVDFMTLGLIGALVLRGEPVRAIPPRIVVIALLVFIASYAVGFLAPYPDAAVAYTTATFLVLATGYVTFQLAARDPEIAERAYVLAGLVLGLETLLAFTPTSLATALRYDRFRVEGLFKDPNVFGPFAVPAVTLLCVRWPRLPLLLRVPALVLVLIPIPASLSRGAVLALALALVTLGAIAAYRRWWAVVIRCAGIVAAGILALAALATVPATLDRLTLSLQSYDTGRVGGQFQGLQRYFENPLSFGLGPGNYEHVLGPTSHETYVRILVETGPLSLIAIVLLLWASVRLIRTPNPSTAAWICALIGLAAYGALIDVLHWRHLWVALVMPLAIAVYEKRKSQAGRDVGVGTT
jgi:O-antigen ligase